MVWLYQFFDVYSVMMSDHAVFPLKSFIMMSRNRDDIVFMFVFNHQTGLQGSSDNIDCWREGFGLA